MAPATDRDEVLTLDELIDRMAKGIRMVEEIHAEGVRRQIVAAPESGEVTVTVTKRTGRLDVVGSRKSDLGEALARAIEQIEDIERRAIERVAAESSELTEEEKHGRILEAVAETHILRKAVATDPDDWSNELKARLLALRPESTTEEFAGLLRDVRAGRVVHRHEGENPSLSVDQDGTMRLNDKPVTFANLGEQLKQQRSLMDSTTIIIQSAKRVPREKIGQIMDIARKAGFLDQVLAMEPQPEP